MSRTGGEGSKQNQPTEAMARLSFYHEPTVREYRQEPGYLTTRLEGFIRSQRLKLQRLWQRYQSTRDSVRMKYQTAQAHSEYVTGYLRSEPVFIERAAIISVAALTGMVIAYRKTALKKASYALMLGGGATAVCYPYQTVHYTTLAYNGVKAPTIRLYKEHAPWNDYTLTSIPVSKSDKYFTTKSEEIKKEVNSNDEDMGQCSSEDNDMYSTREG